MTSAQLAELLYAKSGAKDTLFAKTQSTIKAQLAAGRSNEQIQAAVEQSMNTLATQLAGACQEVASQAAQTAVISVCLNTAIIPDAWLYCAALTYDITAFVLGAENRPKPSPMTACEIYIAG